MKKTIALLALLSCASSKSFATDPMIEKLEQEPMTPFLSPDFKKETLPNGIKFYFLPDSELPIIEITAFIESGSVTDPADKTGLNDFMFDAIRTGGTKTMSADSLDLVLDSTPISVSVDGDREFSVVHVRALAESKDLAFKILFDLLRNAAFEEPKIEIIRHKMLDEIKRRNENPMGIANRVLLEKVYGADNPWARVTHTSTINSISKNDLQSFEKIRIQPNKLRLGVSGQLDESEALVLIHKYAGDWKATTEIAPTVPPIEKKWEASTTLVPKEGNQSAVVLGHFGEKRFNPDKYAIILANNLLGGSSFASKLTNNIRTRLGLAYSVYSVFGFGTDYSVFLMGASTKTESTAKVISEAKATLTQLTKGELVSEKDLKESKEIILNQLIFESEDIGEMIASEIKYDFFGYPAKYLELYQKEINNVSLDQVKNAFKNYFFPDRLKVVIVGDKNGLGTSLGSVEEMPLPSD